METIDYEDEMSGMGLPPSSRSGGSRTPRRVKKQAPQETVREFWEQFNTKFPGKVFTILPGNPYARTKAAHVPKGIIQGQDAVKSYEQARRECQRAVARIVKECERVNQKYTDPHFDIELDLKSGNRDYLDGLDKQNLEMRPRGVKRVTEIFENPQFFINGPTAGDVRQGRDGDCWLMAALCTMGNKSDLIDRICVARNEKVGVYGFVFYRDGEWQQCIVDDKLYLRAADYDESVDERPVWDDINRTDTEEEYRKVWQTGSRALYFAQCADENETWLPLLEKAYAKAHGDYSAIEGGFVGEAIEDLTGGVTSEILSSNILDKDRFWKEELMNVNKEFLFGCATGMFSNWLDPKYRGPPRDRKGISENHSYSIMDAKEINGVRLLRLRNPWGKKEWSGAWSDGSEQWTPQWMERLGHKFGNDGVFWISYEDLLKKYQHFDRTRLFGPEWTITQQWTSLNVPWSADYHSTKFMIELTKKSPVVIVLSQLDTRYFKGLEGEYDFTLQFRLEKEGEGDYIVRSHNNYMMNRSVNTDITLDAGRYFVLMKITAYRNSSADTPEEIVRRLASKRREKLVQIGLSYDLAHTKGVIVETEKEKEEREEREERHRLAERANLREETLKKLQKKWIRDQKIAARQQRVEERQAWRRQQQLHPSADGESLTGSADRTLCKEGHGVQTESSGSTSPVEGANEQVVEFPKRSIMKTTSNGEGATRKSTNGDAVHFNGVNNTKRTEKPTRPIVETNFATDGFDDYERELLEGFEFDSDIDMPPEPPREAKDARARTDISGLDGDEVGNDPWNAVCVVGLRVYSKDPELCLQVVRTIPEDDVEAPLDRDDPAASATKEKGSWSV
ncbi:hypothetical protein VTN00DRAFT_4848 [Thermoascus crustaceus]|uniref:uncharacterized protein n=1 Tax=Thermoascus crustaceus TaxID=5088 RepID=UPI003744225A